ncbi:hypothetical protein V865_003659 [Kwoniella europaea PYCC6329]|uniref:Uncharacterized protein n=1 Tax=Kwoniella europaea PYCC6329 TaxID=1423913 RepID=A0AAX4KHN0_9TREE
MPPKGSGTKPRNSSPIKPTRKPFKTPAAARKARVSEPAPPKAGKRKSVDEKNEDDETDESEKGNDAKKRKVGSHVEVEEEEDIVVVEEEEVEDRVHDDHDKEGDEGSQDIYKELSSKFQSKSRKSRKSNSKTSTKSKELKKLEGMYDGLSTLINDEDIVGKRRATINQLTSLLTDTVNQDIQNAKRKDEIWDLRNERFSGLHRHYEDFLNGYHGPLEVVMKDAIQTYEERPKDIEKTIKEFTKVQKERIKEDENDRITSLDSNKIVQHARKFMLSMIKKPKQDVKQR